VATLARARRVNEFDGAANFLDEEDTSEFTGNAADARAFEASIYSSELSSRNFSSQDQPSF